MSDHQHECKFCGAIPDDEGWVRHGNECSWISEDGGGEKHVGIPDPLCPDPVVEAVVARLRRRSGQGMRKYGTDLTRDDIDLAGWLRHLQEELLDAANYAEAAMRSVEGLMQRLAAVEAERDAAIREVGRLGSEVSRLLIQRGSGESIS